MKEFFYIMVGLSIPIFVAAMAYVVKVIWLAIEDLEKGRK